MTKQLSMEDLLKLLIIMSQRLESYLLQFEEKKNEDENEWYKYIEQRQIILDQITNRVNKGETITSAAENKWIKPFNEMDTRIRHLLEKHKQQLLLELNRIEQGKKQNKVYNKAYQSTINFGYYFDKKK